jgi:23S rRNA pseudouridine1911/1915/1917 synthase
MRIDQYLALRFTGYSRTFLAGLCREGRVLVAGMRARPSRRMLPDEEVTVILPEGAHAEPEEMAIDLVHEDPAVFVVNKPPGVPVHPSRGHLRGTLYHGLLWRFRRELLQIPGFRIGPVHRLDIDTSGLLVYAKDEKVQRRLAQAIEGRDFRKTYIAIVHGRLPFEEVCVDGAIGADEGGKRMCIDGSDARSAVTTVRRLNAAADMSIVALGLVTGRSHQLRVHLSAMGYPIVGDVLYGGSRHGAGGQPLIGRQALHAWRLAIEHPVTGDNVEYSAALPDDMLALAVRNGLEVPS